MAVVATLTGPQIEYATRTKVAELALEISDCYSLLKVKEQIRLSAKLLRYLRVLREDLSLTEEEKKAIYQVLIKLGKLYNIPTAPTVTATRIVNVWIGDEGAQGIPGPAGPPGGAVYATVTGITGTSVIDQIPVGDAYGSMWLYSIVGANTGRRGGEVIGYWSASAVEYYEHQGLDLLASTSALTFSVDISGGQARLVANATSGTWTVAVARFQIEDLL